MIIRKKLLAVYATIATILIAIFLSILLLSSGGFQSIYLQSVTLSGVQVPDVVCFLKTRTEVIGTDGKVLTTNNSPFLDQHPTFSYTDFRTGKDIKQLDHVVAMRCNKVSPTITQQKQQQYDDLVKACEDPNRTKECPQLNNPIIVEQSYLTLAVYSKNMKNEKINTYNAQKPSKQVTLNFGQESDLVKFQIPMNDIKQTLDLSQIQLLRIGTGQADRLEPLKDTYKSLQEFQTKGTLTMHYSGFPKPLWKFGIGTSDVPTYIIINIPKSASTTPKPIPETPIPNDPNCVDLADVIGDENCPTKEEVPNEPVCQGCGNQGSQDQGKGLDSIDELVLCLTTVDQECLKQPKFYAMYALAGFTLFLIIIAYMLGTQNRALVKA